MEFLHVEKLSIMVTRPPPLPWGGDISTMTGLGSDGDAGRVLQEASERAVLAGVRNGAFVQDEMFLAAARALADFVTPEQIENGQLYPEAKDLRKVAATVSRSCPFTPLGFLCWRDLLAVSCLTRVECCVGGYRGGDCSAGQGCKAGAGAHRARQGPICWLSNV